MLDVALFASLPLDTELTRLITQGFKKSAILASKPEIVNKWQFPLFPGYCASDRYELPHARRGNWRRRSGHPDSNSE